MIPCVYHRLGVFKTRFARGFGWLEGLDLARPGSHVIRSSSVLVTEARLHCSRGYERSTDFAHTV